MKMLSETLKWRRWPTSSLVVASAALFIALGGSAVAANGLIGAGSIAPGAITSKAIRDGSVEPRDLSMRTQALLEEGEGATGARGEAGPTGTPGTSGTNGASGANGADGANGANGANGPNGANGANGANGVDGTDGTNGKDGTNGTDGVDGTIAPLSATAGLTDLPSASPPTTVVTLTVPAGNYVVLAKTQLFHTGAGDTVECVLKAGATKIDQVFMKTLPALASIPVSMQAVTVTSSQTQLSVECDVLTANGTANLSSLIAIPTG